MRRRIVDKRMMNALYNILKNREKPSCILTHDGNIFFIYASNVNVTLLPDTYPNIDITGVISTMVMENGDIYDGVETYGEKLKTDSVYGISLDTRINEYEIKHKMKKIYGGEKR